LEKDFFKKLTAEGAEGAEKENGEIRRCEKMLEVCYTADSTFMKYTRLSIPLGRLQEPFVVST
jgi:hypothetical protein